MSGLCAWLSRAPDASPVLLGVPGSLTGRGGAPADITYAELRGALAAGAARLPGAAAAGPLAIAASTRAECLLLVLLAAWHGRPALILPVNPSRAADLRLPDGPGLLCGSAAEGMDPKPGWEQVQIDWPGAFGRPGGPAPAADGPGWILHTSGTTGAPRRVVLGSRSISASVRGSASVLRLSPGDRWLLCLPPDRIGGLMVLARSLACAGAVAVSETFDEGAVAATLAARGISRASVVPAMLEPLLGNPPPESLRTLLVGGAALGPSLGECLRGGPWPAWVSYGMTETCSHVTLAPVDEAWCPGLAGRPLPGAHLEVRGDPGEPGPITVAGPMVMEGYLGEPGLEGPYLTADAGWLDNAGRLHVAGRRDDVIITGGHKVHPARVEAVLAGMPGVESAAVGGVPDARWGQRLAAVYVGEARPEDLAEACRDRLASAERPRDFRRVDALPATDAGKLDRRRLQRILATNPGTDPAGS